MRARVWFCSFAALVLHLAAAPAASAAPPVPALASPAVDGIWSTFTSTLHDPSSVLDAARGRLLVVGRPNHLDVTEVWQMTLGSVPSWSRLETTGTPPGGAAWRIVVHDPTRDRLLLFRGPYQSYLAEVWQLSLGSDPPGWSPITPGGPVPPAINPPVAIVDAARDRLVVYWYSATRVYTLATDAWSTLGTAGTPPAGVAGETPTVIHDTARDRMVLFAENHEGAAVLTTRVFQLTFAGTPTWTQLTTPDAPRIMDREAVVHDPVGDRALLLAGAYYHYGAGIPHTQDSCFTVIRSFSLSTDSWGVVPAAGSIPPRCDGQALYDAPRHRVLMTRNACLSSASTCTLQVWSVDLASPEFRMHASLFDPRPPTASGHVAVLDTRRDRTIAFRGSSSARLWELPMERPGDLDAWSEIAAAGAPPPTSWLDMAAVYDSLRDRLIVVGGSAGVDSTLRVRQLSFVGAPEWSEMAVTNRPPTRYAHTAIYDPVRDRIVVFGGRGTDGYYDDVLALSLTGTPVWARIAERGASPGGRGRSNHSAIYDPNGDRMVVFGGQNDGQLPVNRDVIAFALDTHAWSTLVPIVRSRHSHTAVYDPFRRRMVVYGGGPAITTETFAMELTGPPTITFLAPDGIVPAVMEHTAVFDPRRDRMVAHGGADAQSQVPFVSVLHWAGNVGVDPEPPGLGARLRVFPNPGTGPVHVQFTLGRPGRSRVTVHDLQGRLVARLVDGWLDAGRHRVAWDARREGSALRAGLYFVRLQSASGRAAGRIVLSD